MASSSNTVNGTSKASRFSTLKAFKFNKGSENLKPPPLPPKDHYYLNNRSLVSLSPAPDSQSVPNSPLSPQMAYYQNSFARGPSPTPPQNYYVNANNSSMSLHSSSGDPGPGSQPSSVKSKGSFFRFAKRSPRSPSARSPQPDSPVSGEDENISMPTNFQHNVHVDEALGGLPPSWSASLAEHGFSEEEIAAIQSRRQPQSRSPGSQHITGERPHSPATSIKTTSSTHHPPTSSTHYPPPPPPPSHHPSPIITRPSPRISSLPRKYSDSSLHGPSPSRGISAPPSGSSQHSISSRKAPPALAGHGRKASNSSLALSISVDSEHDKPAPPFGALSPVMSAGTSAQAESGSPSTPPKRTYHIMNITSPPPSYDGFGVNGNAFNLQTKPGAGSTPPRQTPPAAATGSSQGHGYNASIDTTSSRLFTNKAVPSQRNVPTPASNDTTPTNSPPRNDRRRSKRYNALPPRLSLQKDDIADLSSWSEALMSAIPSDLSSSSREQTPLSSTFGHSVHSTSTTNTSVDASPHSNDSSSGLGTVGRKPSQRKPPPPAVQLDRALQEDMQALQSSRAEASSTAGISATTWDGERSPSTGRALWHELAGVVQGEQRLEDEEQEADRNRWSEPALNEAQSPTLPQSPDARPVRSTADSVRPLITMSNANRVSVKSDDKDVTSEWVDDYLDEEYYDGSYLGVGNNRDSSRYSTQSSASTTSTSTVTQMAVVRKVSIARRAVANVIEQKRQPLSSENGGGPKGPVAPRHTKTPSGVESLRPPVSPQSSHFGSEDSGSGSSSSQSHQTPTTEVDTDSSLLYYMESSPGPDEQSFVRHEITEENKTKHDAQQFDDPDFDDEEDSEEAQIITAPNAPRPVIVINNGNLDPPLPTALQSGKSPATPAPRYHGWLSRVVKPLEDFIDEPIDPRDYFSDLHEIAEGESGSVFSATLNEGANVSKLKLPASVKERDIEAQKKGSKVIVAMKIVAILPSGSPKLDDLSRELRLLKGLQHPHLLTMDALYVELGEDTLWVRMELMERSLADVISLTEAGLVLQDRVIARFTGDILSALQYLRSQRIAHRDVRSDNLLLNDQGFLKITDFSNAVQIGKEESQSSDVVGVPYWQAPEMRTGPYDALQVDVWSVGATVWEMAEAMPPFSTDDQLAERWPPLTNPNVYPPSFHEFLRLCSEPAASRPTPEVLLKSAFLSNTCGRPVIVHLLSQCTAIERILQDDEEGSVP